MSCAAAALVVGALSGCGNEPTPTAQPRRPVGTVAGLLVAASAYDAPLDRLSVIDLATQTTRIVRLDQPLASGSLADVAPDRRHIAGVGSVDGLGSVVFVVDLETGHVVTRAAPGADGTEWAPDGRLAFAGTHPEAYDGLGTTRLEDLHFFVASGLLSHIREIHPVLPKTAVGGNFTWAGVGPWSPTGADLLLVVSHASEQDGRGGLSNEIFVLGQAGQGRVRRIAESSPEGWSLQRAAWSPDGTRIAVPDDVSGVDVVGADGRRIVELPTEGAVLGLWWTDSGLYVEEDGGDRVLLAVFDPMSGQRGRTVASSLFVDAVSPDGQRVAMIDAGVVRVRAFGGEELLRLPVPALRPQDAQYVLAFD